MRFNARRFVRVAGRLAICLCVAAIVATAGEALGCPTCKDGVAESDPEGVNLARGYFYSILLMLAMPFTLAGSFGAYVWREMRRLEAERRVGGDPVPAPGTFGGPGHEPLG